MPVYCVVEHVHVADADRPALHSHAEGGNDQTQDAGTARTPIPRLRGRVAQGWRE